MSASDSIFRDDSQVRKFVLDVVKRGLPDLDVSESIVAGGVTQTIEGASTLTITVHDFGREIIKSGIFDNGEGQLRTIDAQLDGFNWRLVKLAKGGDDLPLTFEEREVAYLKGKKGPRKAARSKVTRAEFILLLVRSIKVSRIKTVIPDLHIKQPVGKAPAVKEAKKDARDTNREKGFPDNAKIEGVNGSQLRKIATCLEVADEIRAGTRPTLAMLCAGFGESEFGESVGNRGTTFQTLLIPEADLDLQARHFLQGGRSFLAGGAIGYARSNPSATSGEIASKVEISDAAGAHYDKHRGRARRVLDAWGGSEGGGSGSGSGPKKYKRYEFKVDKKESYWDAIQRMAKEVRWRSFVVKGVFYYIDEEDLFKSRARARLSEDTDGINYIDFDWDVNKVVNKATISCRIDRWFIPPGSVVLLEDLGPANGRWLVSAIDRDLFSSEGTITLKRPSKPAAEPRPEEAQKSGDDSGGGASGAGDRESGAQSGSPVPGQKRQASTHPTAGLPGYPAYDYMAPAGTPCVAPASGKIDRISGKSPKAGGPAGGAMGYSIYMTGGGNSYFMTHIDKVQVKAGDEVEQGQKIAVIADGPVTWSTPHVHMGVKRIG